MIDLKKLRRISADMAVWYAKDANIVAKAANELERLRASELALKRELLRALKKRAYTLSERCRKASAPEVIDDVTASMINNENRIQQLEQEINGGGS